MARIVECPKCGADVSHTYEGCDPSVGIMSGGWYCEKCDLAIPEEDQPDYELDLYQEGYSRDDKY